MGPERIELHETDEPTPDPGDVTIEVGAVGICGTDLSIFAGKIPVEYPRVMGHEIVGTVVGGTSGDGRIAEGTAVLVDPGIACGRCVQCREDRANICTNGWLLGRDRDGGLRERMTVPGSNVHALPAGVATASVPMIQVLATCVHAQHRLAPSPGQSVVVIGLGVTGLLHVQLAKLAGAAPVIGVTRSAEKLELSGELGADELVPADGSESAGVAEILPEGADVVIECVGSVGALAKAIEMVRVGGRILAYGTITATGGELPFYEIYRKEISLAGARSARAEDFPTAIDAVASGRVVVDRLVSGRFPIERIDDALRAAAAPGAMKVLVDV